MKNSHCWTLVHLFSTKVQQQFCLHSIIHKLGNIFSFDSISNINIINLMF